MKHISLILASVFILAFSLTSFATANLPSANAPFEKTILQAQKSCPTLKCVRDPVQVQALTSAELSRLDAATKAALAKGMNTVADIWPDTILEGGYETDFQLRLDQVEAVMLSEQRIGFRFTFSAAATDEDKRLGRIIERGFISQDFKAGFRDETALAHFQTGAL